MRHIKDQPIIPKPLGGLWGSPVDSEHSWFNWALENDFNQDRFDTHFKFEVNGNILTIDCEEDLYLLPWISTSKLIPGWPLCGESVSFERLVERDIDAIFLTEKGQYQTHLSHPRSLYGWDCESVLVLNPECIITI